MTDKQQIGRLAMRAEGTLWVAYYAQMGTMKDAIFLGSIRLVFVQDESAKQIFMALMRDSIAAYIKDETGAALEWPDLHGVPAPAHEKGGRA